MSINMHTLLANGISRHHDAPQPHLDLLDAESALALSVERHGLLYRPNFGVTSGAFLRVEADTRRCVLVVSLLLIDSHGDVEKTLGRVDMAADDALAAAARVAAMEPDGLGQRWASCAFIECGGAA